MLRRVLLTVSLAALALTGAASATLVGCCGAPPDADRAFAGRDDRTRDHDRRRDDRAGRDRPATTTAALDRCATRRRRARRPRPCVDHRPRLGARARDEPVGRLRLRAARLDATTAILAHYYPGTTLGTRPAPTVRVLLADGAGDVTLGSAAPWSRRRRAGVKVRCPPGKLVARARRSPSTGKSSSLPPLTFAAGKEPLRSAGSRIAAASSSPRTAKLLQVVNAVALEPVPEGRRPAEMPSTWPAEALEAQAVAARSYALANLTTVVTASNFDLYQRHAQPGLRRHRRRDAGHDARRRGDRAAGRPLRRQGRDATSPRRSGGRTASAAEATGRRGPVPRLGRRPVRHALAVPRLGPGPLRRARSSRRRSKLAGGRSRPADDRRGPSGARRDA